MPNFLDLSARDLAQLIRTGRVTRSEVISAALERTESMNPQVGALVAIRGEDALREAQQADRAGVNRGPLDGVPVSVKAEFDVTGLPTSHGSRKLKPAPAAQDSPVVDRLRASGAIVIGKGNQPDFAMRWNTHSSELGWTRNPRDLSASVSGSSGGDAAAVAAGMVALGFGTDLAGSIRVPAAFCQIYGLRSTPGRIPYASETLSSVRTPAVEAMSSQGPLARSVDDLRLAFEATAGASSEHPFSTSAPGALPEPLGRPRVARIIEQAGAVIDPAVVAEVDVVCAALEDAGYVVEDAAFPGIERVPDIWGELLCTELRLKAIPHLSKLMDPSCLDHIDKLSQIWPTLTSTDAYIARWEEWSRVRRSLFRWLAKYPLIVSPIAGMSLPLPLEYDHWADSTTLTGLVDRMRNSLWPACLGLPSLALPNGVQLVAGPHHDDALFEPARVVEAILPACTPSFVNS